MCEKAKSSGGFVDQTTFKTTRTYGFDSFILDDKSIASIDKYVKHRPLLKEVPTLHNVFAVHWGVCSTLRMFSTPGGYHEYSGGYHEYTGGCSVHRGAIMSTVGGYHEYTGGCSVHWGI